jgi:uncharacterized protein YtpQ (UPF0354 family)
MDLPSSSQRSTLAAAAARVIAFAFAMLTVQCQSVSEPRPSADATTAAHSTQPIDVSSESAMTESAARLFRAESSRISARVVEPLTLALVVTGREKRDLRISLDRVWAGCQTSPPGCETDLRDFVSKAARTVTAEPSPAAREQVVAVLRPRAYVDTIGGPSTSLAMIEPFVDDLYAIYVVDGPDSTRSLKPSDLESLKLTRDQVAPLAKTNLRQRLGDAAAAIGEAKAGDVVVVQSGDAFFQSSRLLLTDEWAALSAKVGQPVVVAVPANDALIVAIGPNPRQIAKLSEGVVKLFGSASRPVSRRLFQWSAGGWTLMP